MLTINLDDSLGQELNTLALQTNKPLDQLLTEIINDYFNHTLPVFEVNVTVNDYIWTAECDALGLVTEADSYDKLIARAWEIAPELAELNGIAITADKLRLRFLHEQTKRSEIA